MTTLLLTFRVHSSKTMVVYIVVVFLKGKRERFEFSQKDVVLKALEVPTFVLHSYDLNL